jgi:hypothetical protein
VGCVNSSPSVGGDAPGGVARGTCQLDLRVNGSGRGEEPADLDVVGVWVLKILVNDRVRDLRCPTAVAGDAEATAGAGDVISIEHRR